MADLLNQERREECRRAVLDFLATRQAVAHHPATIQRRLNAGHQNDFTVDEVNGALVFLAGVPPGLVKATFDKLGATRYWQATSEGVLAAERGDTTA